MGKYLLIDGDVICYRAGFATDKTKYAVLNQSNKSEWELFDDAKSAKAMHGNDAPLWSRKEAELVDKALMLVDVMIGDIKSRYPGYETRLFLSGVGNFRYSIATRASYKGNRAGAAQPAHMKAIRKHLIDRGAEVSKGEEADDAIGIAITSNPDSIVVSIDKDLLQLPGKHYNFVTKEEVTVNKKDAVLNFYAQVLSGDATDNIPGLIGYGPVKARKALEDCKNPAQCWERCLSLYYNEFTETFGEQYALEAARLVYVRRTEGEIWSPPSKPVSTSSSRLSNVA